MQHLALLPEDIILEDFVHLYLPNPANPPHGPVNASQLLRLPTTSRVVAVLSNLTMSFPCSISCQYFTSSTIPRAWQ